MARDSHCFVPGCRSGYPSDRKKNKIEEKRNPSLFLPPRDAVLLQKWKIAIRRADKELTRENKVCELHFLEEDVNKFHVTKLWDGTIHKMERVTYALNINAVPRIFPNRPAYLSENISKRKLPAVQVESQKKIKVFENITCAEEDAELFKKLKIAIPRTDKELTSESRICELHLSEDDIEKFHITELSDGKIHETEKSKYTLKVNTVPKTFPNVPTYLSKNLSQSKLPALQVESPKKIKVSEEICLNDVPVVTENPVVIHLPVVTEKDIFSRLLSNLNIVAKPNFWWGVTHIANFVMCAKWNSNYTQEKQVIIQNNLCLKVFMKDREVEILNLPKIRCVEDVSTVLKLVESYRICAGADDISMKDCLFHLPEKVSTMGKPQIWCKECTRTRRNACRRVCIKKTDNTKQKLYQRYASAKRRNCRLEKKVTLLRKKIEASKKMCAATKHETLKEPICNETLKKTICNLPALQQESIKHA